MNEMKLASLIAKLEGKRSEVHIGNIREIIRVIQILLRDEAMAYNETGTSDVGKILFKKASSAMKKRNEALLVEFDQAIEKAFPTKKKKK